MPFRRAPNCATGPHGESEPLILPCRPEPVKASAPCRRGRNAPLGRDCCRCAGLLRRLTIDLIPATEINYRPLTLQPPVSDIAIGKKPDRCPAPSILQAPTQELECCRMMSLMPSPVASATPATFQPPVSPNATGTKAEGRPSPSIFHAPTHEFSCCSTRSLMPSLSRSPAPTTFHPPTSANTIGTK